jgi:hypothetical protein
MTNNMRDMMEGSEIVQIVLGLFTLVGTLGGGYLAYKSGIKKKTAVVEKTPIAELEVKYNDSGKNFLGYLSAWNDIERCIADLLSTSSLDRFIMLRGWNGVRDPEFTTAVYQYKSESDKYQAFQSLPLDDDYRAKLRHTYKNPLVFVTAEQQEGCLIRRIYELEGIKSTVWYFISSDAIQGIPERATMYCSFGSTGEEVLDAATLLRSELLVAKIKEVMGKFADTHK